MMRYIHFLDKLLNKTESRIGLFFTSVLVGIVLLLTASLYVMPKFGLSHHGIWYAQLSQHPFNFSEPNPLQFRILTPLIGYLLHVPIKFYFVIPLFFAVALLSVIYFWYRRKVYTPSGAMAMSALITFSTTLFIPLISPGYGDVVTYFFIFLAFIFLDNKKFFVLSFCAALFNHEMALILLPGLFAISVWQSENKWRELLYFPIAAGLAFLPYYLFRLYVAQQTQTVYDFEFYTSLENVSRNFRLVARLTPIGAFFSFKLFWFIILFFVVRMIQLKKYSELFPVLIILFCTGLQMLFAYDITRLFSIAFVAILFSADRLKFYFPEKPFSYYAWMLIALNFFVPQYFVSQEGLNDIFPPVVYWMEYLLKQ